MAVDFSRVNAANLRAFGQTLTLAYAPRSGAAAFSVTGIVETGELEEGLAPGSSTNARLWVVSSQFTAPSPEAGDEVTIGSNVYKVVGDPERDAIGGIWLRLRLDREVV